MLKDNVLLKEIPRPFCISDVSSAGHLKIFLGVSLGFFFVFSCCCFSFFFFFVFVPCGKSSVFSYDVLVVFFSF